MHHGKLDHVIHKIMHILEYIIVFVTLAVLVGSLAVQIIHVFTDAAHVFEDVEHFLHGILTVVVGLEFVHMLLDTTPANVLQVLIVAITRHVVLSHEDPWSNVACIACIAGLFAVRRFLIPKNELKEEMSEAHH